MTQIRAEPNLADFGTLVEEDEHSHVTVLTQSEAAGYVRAMLAYMGTTLDELEAKREVDDLTFDEWVVWWWGKDVREYL